MKSKHPTGRTRTIKAAFAVVLAVATVGSCSLKQLAMDTVIGALSEGGGTSFTGDDDPQLVADALPFALKLYEILLEESPDNPDLLLTTGSGFVMYANAFVQTPSEQLPDSEYEKRREMRGRAKRLYIRGRDYVLRALEVYYPGFTQALEGEQRDEALDQVVEEHVPLLYWASAGWMGAVSIDSFDVKLGITRDQAIALMLRALELDEEYSDGAIHEFLISYYGALPEMMGGSEEKARYHFARAVEISEGRKPGPYVSLATAVSIKNQDVEEFKRLLETALAIEPDDPDSRLVTIVTQEKARWLLDHIEDFFLI